MFHFIVSLFQKVESEGEDPVNIENTLWANTVIATGKVDTTQGRN